MFSKALILSAKNLLFLCKQKSVMLATAESCTGGLIAGLLTEIPGSSDVFERGFVTYSNKAKHTSIGVGTALLKQAGAVSKEVAVSMAKGALKHSEAGLSIAVTGIAGPGGGTKAKPVGLVYIAVAYKKNKPVVKEFHFKGGREAVRMAALAKALQMAREALTHFA